MKIGIDIDDTIADTYEVMFNYAQEYTVNVLKREPVISDVENPTHFYIETLHNWNEEESEKFWMMYFKKIIQNAKPKTFSVEYLEKIHNEKNEIILITARHQDESFDFSVEEETKKWVEKNNILCDKIIIDAQEKQKIAELEKIDLFIDDSFKNCKAVSDSGIKTYIMDSKVNKNLNRVDIERVYSWPHVYMKLKKQEKEEL